MWHQVAAGRCARVRSVLERYTEDTNAPKTAIDSSQPHLCFMNVGPGLGTARGKVLSVTLALLGSIWGSYVLSNIDESVIT